MGARDVFISWFRRHVVLVDFFFFKLAVLCCLVPVYKPYFLKTSSFHFVIFLLFSSLGSGRGLGVIPGLSRQWLVLDSRLALMHGPTR